MWFLTSGIETTTAPWNPEIVRWVIPRESKGQGGGMTPKLLLGKYASLKIWSLHPEPGKTAWSQFSNSVASGGPSSVLPVSVAKWTRMLSLSLKSSQRGVNCDCHSSSLHTVVRLLGQPHKYITLFVSKGHWQKPYTSILVFPEGASFKAGCVAVLTNSPTSKPKLSAGKAANCVITFFHQYLKFVEETGHLWYVAKGIQRLQTLCGWANALHYPVAVRVKLL